MFTTGLTRGVGQSAFFFSLKKIFPEAPLYTSIYNPQKAPWAKNFAFFFFLQKMPGAAKRKAYLPLLPLALKALISTNTTWLFPSPVLPPKELLQSPIPVILAIFSLPPAFAPPVSSLFLLLLRKPLQTLVGYLKRWDKIAAFRPDKIIAISQTVAKRTEKYYQQEAEKIIYPPVDTQKFFPTKKRDKGEKYFLLVSRLEPYKKVDLAISAFNSLGWKLKIVGKGSEEKKLKKISRKNIEFLGKVSDQKLVSLYQNCQAVIFPQEEDFGLVPLEAQACGRPVVAFRGGGARETIVDGKTGLFFFPQTSMALKALLNFLTWL